MSACSGFEHFEQKRLLTPADALRKQLAKNSDLAAILNGRVLIATRLVMTKLVGPVKLLSQAVIQTFHSNEATVNISWIV